MNPISIKHSNGWPNPPETYVLDYKNVKLVVFHGTMFGDDDTDVYGFLQHDGTQLWIATHFFGAEDFATFVRWLKTYFEIVSSLNDDRPPEILWPKTYEGIPFFEPTLTGRLIGAILNFPACYEKREMSEVAKKIMVESP